MAFNILGYGPVQPSNVTGRSFDLTEDTQLQWPFTYADSPDVTGNIMRVNPQSANLKLYLPSALFASSFQSLIITNTSGTGTPISFSVYINEPQPTGTSGPPLNQLLQTIAQGEMYFIYSITNDPLSAAASRWAEPIQYGVTPASGSPAGALAGPGLKATSGASPKLETNNLVVSPLSAVVNVTLDDTYRSKILACGVTNTINLGNPTGADEGFYFYISNVVGGAPPIITVKALGRNINDVATDFTVDTAQGVMMITDGVDWFTFGSQALQQIPLPISDGGTNATTAAGAYQNITGSNAPGDLIQGGINGNPSVLPIGAYGESLTSEGNAVQWGGLSVLDFVSTQINTPVFYSAAGGVTDYTIKTSITTDNILEKVFVMFDVYVSMVAGGAVSFPYITYTLQRDVGSGFVDIYTGVPNTTPSQPAATGTIALGSIADGAFFNTRISGQYLDSPAHAGSFLFPIEYRIEFKGTLVLGQEFAINRLANGSDPILASTGSSSMTLIRIAGF